MINNNLAPQVYSTAPASLSTSHVGKNTKQSVSVIPQKEVQPCLEMLPPELLGNIVSRLTLRDIIACSQTSQKLKNLINETDIGKKWYSRFSSQQQAGFSMIAKGLSNDAIDNWLTQFSMSKVEAKNITKRRQATDFTPTLISTVSRLMAGCKTFKVEKKATINDVILATSSADGRHVMFICCDTTTRIYAKIYGRGEGEDGNWTEKTTIRYNISRNNKVQSAYSSPDCRHMVVTFMSGTVKIYGTGENTKWTEKASIPHNSTVRSFKFSPDCRHLVTTCMDNTSKIWGMGKGEEGKWTEKLSICHKINSFSFSADSSHLVIINNNGNAIIYGMGEDENWMEKSTMLYHGSGCYSVTLSPDGRHMVIINDYGNAKIYGMGEGDIWTEKAGIPPNIGIESANFSADGRHIVVTCDDKTAKIYGKGEDTNWTEKATIHHGGKVNSANFSPDGLHVVTSSEDQTAKIYGKFEGTDWTEKAIIHHDGQVHSANFSPDGRYVVTTSGCNTANIWRLCCKNYRNYYGTAGGLSDYDYTPRLPVTIVGLLSFSKGRQ